MNLLKEVAEKVNRPFEVKLAETKEVIRHHFEEFSDNKLATTLSGGKDSEAVTWLCLQFNPNISVVFNNTSVEYPETVRFVAYLAELWNLNLTITHPEKTFWQCVDEAGFPDSSKRHKRGGKFQKCCYWLKEKPMRKAISKGGFLGFFTGTTAVESWQRMFNARDKGMCYHQPHYNACKINPILWWTEQEVWDFIACNNLPTNPVYKMGAERVGCMPCTAYKKWEEQMQKVNPRMYEIIKLRKDRQYVMRLI